MESRSFTEDLKGYFGESPGGVNLKKSLENLPLTDLQNFCDAVKEMPAEGRLFFFGNGGSFDNARIMASISGRCGFKASIPGNVEEYPNIISEHGFEHIFSESLKAEKITPNDIVVGISGSGNSPNVLKGLSYALSVGAATFAFGGRDGGMMASVIEKGNTILAGSNCMEVIEDTNNFMAYAVFQSIKEETSLTSSVLSLLKQYQEFLNGNNYEKLSEILENILTSYKLKGRIFLVGYGIGLNHFRADLKRGATNTLPLRSLNVPEINTVNTFLATGNDDGASFGLAAGLSGFCPGENDFALLCEEYLSSEEAEYCREILEHADVPVISVSRNGLDLTYFDDAFIDSAFTMLGHASSTIINAQLKEAFKIRPLDKTPGFPEGHKKLGRKGTLELEDKYRAAGIITANEVLTFSYGQVHAVSSAEPFERNFF